MRADPNAITEGEVGGGYKNHHWNTVKGIRCHPDVYADLTHTTTDRQKRPSGIRRTQLPGQENQTTCTAGLTPFRADEVQRRLRSLRPLGNPPAMSAFELTPQGCQLHTSLQRLISSHSGALVVLTVALWRFSLKR